MQQQKQQQLPLEGLVKGDVLWDNPNKNYLGIMAMSRSTFLKKVKDGELPLIKPVKLVASVRYRVEDVRQQLAALSGK